MEQRLSRQEKRKARQAGTKENFQPKINFVLQKIDPLTQNQRQAFAAYEQGRNLLLHGTAGTGKTFLSLYLSLREILSGAGKYNKLVIVRSVVPTRDMGFLPGNSKEKAKVYEAPYYAICTELFGRGDAYEYLKSKNLIEFISTSFIRGVTLNDCIIVVDEIANCTLHELDSVITRMGYNCRIVFCGDFRQSDFVRYSERNGLLDFMKIVKNMKSFSFVEFNETDIVRSPTVKDYIIQKDKLGIVT